ncbi:MAG: cytochrome d ubiquinol oxidase subunit II [Deltaproteobacteria bacterium]|nr:cytochrome d ubiquinol oxidase subunit II [Deltaproteobacteria bacterium]
MNLGWAELVAGIALLALAIYAVTGGADFGAGIWDRLAAGPRKQDQRDVIEKAIAPIWETNHVWLIFVVVLLFSAFPNAFATIGIALYAPLSLVLLGIVLRGAGFVFRQYGHGSVADRQRWGRTFGGASVLTPFFLGTALAAISSGSIRVDAADRVRTSVSAWLGWFPVTVGVFVMTAFGFVAAVYLCIEANDKPELQDDFRRRALVSGLVLGALSFAVRFTAEFANPVFARRLFGWQGTALMLQTGVAAVALATLFAVFRRRYRIARGLAVLQVVTIVAGWGYAQYPYVIAPDLLLATTAAPVATLRLIALGVGVGAILLIPSLIWMFRVFKTP